MDNFFQEMAESFVNAHRIVGQMAEETQQDKTVIVQPQLGKDKQEAEKIATDWEYRKRKQLFDNLLKELS